MDKNYCALCGRKRTSLEPQRKSIRIEPRIETIWPVPGGKPAEGMGTSAMIHAYISIRRNGGEDDNIHICFNCAQESLVYLRNEIDRMLGENEAELTETIIDEKTRFALYVIKWATKAMRILTGVDYKDLIKTDPPKWASRLRSCARDFQSYYERLGEYFPGLDMEGVHEEPLDIDPVAYVEGLEESDRQWKETYKRFVKRQNERE